MFPNWGFFWPIFRGDFLLVSGRGSVAWPRKFREAWLGLMANQPIGETLKAGYETLVFSEGSYVRGKLDFVDFFPDLWSFMF